MTIPLKKGASSLTAKGSSQDPTPLAKSPPLENKNSFEVLQELKDPELEATDDQAQVVPSGPSKTVLAAPSAKEASPGPAPPDPPQALGHEAPT